MVRKGRARGVGRVGGWGVTIGRAGHITWILKELFEKLPRRPNKKQTKYEGKILARRIIYQDKVLEQNELVWLVGELLRGPHRSFDTLGNQDDYGYIMWRQQ